MLRTINFMGVRNVAFGVTVLLTVLALFSMFHKGMNYGLDFTGGTLIELTYEKPADLTKVRNELVSAGFHDAVVQSFGATTDLLVRMPGDDPLLGNKVAAALGQADTSNPAVIKRVEFVGPQVGEELRDQGGLGMLMALGGIMLYLAFRFQWKFAVGAIVSLVHDVIVTMGVLSAVMRRTWVDYGATVLALFGISMPVFWWGLLLMMLFSVKLMWLPSGGMDTWVHLILPSVVLGTASAGIIARMTRSSMLDVLKQDYITTAKAKGLRERLVVGRHALRNALIPTVTVIGLQFGQLLAGAVLTETVFSLPGVGRLLVTSILARDFPVVQATLVIVAVFFVLVNLAVDILYGILDPRIRYHG